MVATRQSKVTVLLQVAEFDRLDEYCLTQGFKKSTLIARLIREHLNAAGFLSQRSLPLSEKVAEQRRGAV